MAEMRAKKNGKYKRVVEAFENGFEGTAQQCRDEFIPDGALHSWYAMANRIGKKMRKRNISFGSVKQPNGICIYKIIKETEDANINTTTSLEALRNKAVISMKQVMVNVQNFPEIAPSLLPLLFPLQQTIGEAGNKLLLEQSKVERRLYRELKAKEENGNS